MNLGTGVLSPEQVDLVLRHLPGEITVVDENDAVVYYSEPKTRIFSRTPDCLNRPVQECHKPETRDAVSRLLGDFRAGKQDRADMPTTKDGRTVNVRYVALRDSSGAYRGCLEIAQYADEFR